MSLEHGFERAAEQAKLHFSDPVVSADGNVVLRRYRPEDIPEAFALVDADRQRFSRNGVGAGLNLPSKRCMEGEYVTMNTRNTLNIAVRNREREYVGHLRLSRIMINPDIGGLYYYLGAQHEGHGYMTSAVRTITEVALEEMGFDEIRGAVFPANVRSGAVLEGAGFQREGLTGGLLRFRRFKLDGGK